jgi:hypothetical protein
MKKIIAALSVVVITGCSIILPIPHDPAMFNSLVEVKIAVDKISCQNKDWSDAQNKIKHLKVYTQIRKDPQANSISQLEDAINKAKESKNDLFCENILKINRTRINVIAEAWEGR